MQHPSGDLQTDTLPLHGQRSRDQSPEVLLAAEASVTGRAGAGEGSHVVGTGAGAAWAAETLIHVQGAAGASEAREAGTQKGAHAVLARATVEAGVCGQKEGRLVAHLTTLPPPTPRQPCLTPPGLARRESEGTQA
uniref:Uncharacterized protein n=1 Tax=Equus asinus TaxID=9793 RepID=A0A8C4PGW3_EQUAS